MQRSFLYFAAFTGMGAVFAATLIVAALVLGGGDARGLGAGESDAPTASAPVVADQAGEITISAFDLR